MPRPPRVDYAGAWHHVMNRGADRRSIFDSTNYRLAFLDALCMAAERSELEVHACCLMDNHFHLLVHSREGQLSAAMQLLAGRFTRVTNVRADRDGRLLRGRYRSVGINSDADLVQACRYIHLNPVVARMTLRPDDWRWSSAAAYSGTNKGPEWLTTDFILDLFGPTDRQANYLRFMAEGVDATTARFYTDLDW
jgi:putative transposase